MAPGDAEAAASDVETAVPETETGIRTEAGTAPEAGTAGDHEGATDGTVVDVGDPSDDHTAVAGSAEHGSAAGHSAPSAASDAPSASAPAPSGDHTEFPPSSSHSAPAHVDAAPLIESTQIRRAITVAEKRTDLNWSVFIGALGTDSRAQAEARHAEIGPAAGKSVLIAVDPAAHRLEIVTGAHARVLLDDRSCALAAASMTSTFEVSDLDGGIARGILAMVEHVRRGG